LVKVVPCAPSDSAVIVQPERSTIWRATAKPAARIAGSCACSSSVTSSAIDTEHRRDRDHRNRGQRDDHERRQQPARTKGLQCCGRRSAASFQYVVDAQQYLAGG
jgi:hypothetical protein